MELILFLLGFPLISAVLLLIPNQFIRSSVTRLSALVIGAASIYVAYKFFGKPQMFVLESIKLGGVMVTEKMFDKLFFVAEIALSAYLLFRCLKIKAREFYIPLLILAQAGLMIFLETKGHLPKVHNAFYIDNFSIIMVLIIGIIGSLITVYAINYMKDFQHHHHDVKDRQNFFFFILFFFLSAMFGIVLTNNIVWMYLFWEITTLASFELIGYSRTEEAKRNAYRALGLNSIGGLAFTIAIYYMVTHLHTIEMSTLLAGGAAVALIPAVLISFAGMTKSAQMPFSSWLLGAMVAPTPVSALLHSSTMVKAGVFVLVKFAPVLSGTYAGYMIALIGSITFLMTSIIAVTQSNAKRVLAYSTIANLGLVVACAGIGTQETIWAAILLIIFHAVAKALLFLAVGTTEHKIGSRDIEDMGGLMVTRPGLAIVMLIGILGMFLAPFGMLISKWLTLRAFMDATMGGFPIGVVLGAILAFGSAPTLFFWAKWMGKLVSIPAGLKKATDKIAGDEWLVLFLLAVLTIVSCGIFPLVAKVGIEPYLAGIFGSCDIRVTLSTMAIMAIMLAIVLLMPIYFLLAPKTDKLVMNYMAGANIDKGSTTYQGSLGVKMKFEARNYYLTQLFNENKLTVTSVVVTLILIVVMFGVTKI